MDQAGPEVLSERPRGIGQVFAVFASILDAKCDGFTDVGEGFPDVPALAATVRQGRTGDHVTALRIGLQGYLEIHYGHDQVLR
jgi:hypothetical protein